jgi:RHS repeat-associated protein
MTRRIFIFMMLSLCLSLVFHAQVCLAEKTLDYEYDANGNLIRGDGKFLEYDDANRLVRVRQSNEKGAVIAEYVYDYRGQRVKKVEKGSGSNNPGVMTYYIGKHFEKQVKGKAPGETCYFFANGQRVARKSLIEKQGSSGNNGSNGNGNQGGNNSSNGNGNKEPVEEWFFYHSDHLGGTNVVTDSAGELAERTRYFPFGEIREGGSDRYDYTGKEMDAATDFYYFEARYYYPGFKQFTQADVVAPNIYDPQSLNRYAYVLNNPFKYVDPTGKTSVLFFEDDKSCFLPIKDSDKPPPEQKPISHKKFIKHVKKVRDSNNLKPKEGGKLLSKLKSEGGAELFIFPKGPDYKYRFVKDPATGKIIDMRHFLVIGQYGEELGDSVEDVQGAMGKYLGPFFKRARNAGQSAGKPEDYFSNDLGREFYKKFYDGNGSLTDQLERYFHYRENLPFQNLS